MNRKNLPKPAPEAASQKVDVETGGSPSFPSGLYGEVSGRPPVLGSPYRPDTDRDLERHLRRLRRARHRREKNRSRAARHPARYRKGAPPVPALSPLRPVTTAVSPPPVVDDSYRPLFSPADWVLLVSCQCQMLDSTVLHLEALEETLDRILG